ncbi:MAG: hypothetical protein ABIZ70_14895 [Gemmatimonadales bacterium]
MRLADIFNSALLRIARVAGATLAEVREVRGFRVEITNSRSDIATEDVVARLDDAIAMLERYQPVRVAHMRRDIAGITVERYACRGAYLPGQRTILTELTFLARRDIGVEVVASSLIHEATHARIHRGAPNHTISEPAREERICRRVELAFGESLPPELGVAVIERAAWTLALSDDEVAPRPSPAETRAAVEAVDRAARGEMPR